MTYSNSNDMMAFEATRGTRDADDLFIEMSGLMTVGGLNVDFTDDLFPVFSLRAIGPFSDVDPDARIVRRLRYLFSVYGAQWMRDHVQMWREVMDADPTGERLHSRLLSLHGGMTANAGGRHYLAVLLKKLIDERLPQDVTGEIHASSRDTDAIGTFGTPGTLFQIPKAEGR